MENEVPMQLSWFDKIKQTLHIDELTRSLNISKQTVIDIALYAGIGFLIGFLFKKYSYIVAVAVVIGLGIIILHQFEFISLNINWNHVNDVLGIKGASMPVETNWWEWIKTNAIALFSFFVGIALGLKIG
jgi:uncharacterized membrane protein (Fun14 family)